MTLHLLLACLLFVGVHVPVSHAGPLPPTYDSSMCSNSSWCGSVEIKYPFYLADKTKETTDSTTTYSCGYTDLKILCHEETRSILLADDQYYKYKVKAIDYDTRSILLADDDEFGVGTARCRAALHNVTFGPNWLSYEDSAHDNLTFLLDCYSQPGDDMPAGLDVYKIDCQAPGGGISLVFSSEQSQVPQDLELAEHCDQVIVMPVLKDPRRNLSMLPRGYSDVLKKGFQLEWYTTTRDKCNLCEQSDGRCSYSQNKLFLCCLCAEAKVATTNCSSYSGDSSIPSPSRNKRTKIIYIIASVSCVLPLCLIILTFCLTHKYGCSILSKNKDTPSIESFLQKNGNMHPKRYTYTEVKRMTKSFAVKLGQGGFGAVYRGNLPDGRVVAVKMLKDTKGDGEEFMNEVSSISRTSHVNVVTLLGFCLQGSKRALLYEFMPNGSLERYAFNNNLSSENTLTWEKLFEKPLALQEDLNIFTGDAILASCILISNPITFS